MSLYFNVTDQLLVRYSALIR